MAIASRARSDFIEEAGYRGAGSPAVVAPASVSRVRLIVAVSLTSGEDIARKGGSGCAEVITGSTAINVACRVAVRACRGRAPRCLLVTISTSIADGHIRCSRGERLA